MKKLLVAGVALLFSNLLFSQKITGKITDEAGSPLPGTSVWLLETREGTVADEMGIFTLHLDKTGTYTLRVSFVGYETGDQAVDVPAPNPSVDCPRTLRQPAPRTDRDGSAGWRKIAVHLRQREQ
ncbi:MAG: carboxypeptidase-like regulatory domain-containing protein [Saprospiraceae bacterium]|nr:carboxypeptidase-like regulatory domain-containing protein [Saprospiraceae bacterium]